MVNYQKITLKQKNFVKGIHYNGVPYKEAADLGDEAVGHLKKMIKNKENRNNYLNITTTIGFIGSEEGDTIIKEFIEREIDVQDDNAFIVEYRAKSNSLIALGFVFE